jgi:trigger factor
VKEALESIRQSRARYVADDARLAETGDVIIADLDEQPAGEELKKREKMLLEVGAPGNPEPFNLKLLGARPGAVLAFEVDYPADHANAALAGKKVGYRLAVHEVKRKETPPLDDTLAKELGEFENLESLKARVRSDLSARKAALANSGVRQAILDKVLVANRSRFRTCSSRRKSAPPRRHGPRNDVPRRRSAEGRARLCQLRDRNEEPARRSSTPGWCSTRSRLRRA